MHRIKAKILLLLIVVIWLYLALCMLPFQLFITIAPIWHRGLRNYRYRFWIAQDQYVNVILGGNPDVTISSKVGYMALQGSRTAQIMERVIDWIFYVAIGQKNHCFESIELDERHNTWQR